MPDFTTTRKRSKTILALGAIACGLGYAQPSVTNGSFEAVSNASFGSEHTWVPPLGPMDLYTEGTMTIGVSPKSHHSYYQDFTTKWGSKMLIVNAKPTANSLVWSQTISGFTVGSQYRISVQALSAYDAGFAQLYWKVGSQQQTPSITLGPPTASWSEVAYSFTATATSLAFELRNANGSNSGNDFAIDNVVLTPPGKEYIRLGGRLIAIETLTGAGGSGPSNPTLAVSPLSFNPTAAGGSQSETLTLSSAVAWTATSNQTWLTVNPSSGTGSGTFSLTASANPTTSIRPATVTVSLPGYPGVTPISISINQAAGGAGTPTLTVTPSSFTPSAAGGTQSATITLSSSVAWSAQSSQPWLTVSAASGTGSGALTMTAGLNPGSTPRSAAVTVSLPAFPGVPPAVVNVNQAAGNGGVAGECTFTNGQVPTEFVSKACPTTVSISSRKEEVIYTAYHPQGADKIAYFVMYAAKPDYGNGIHPSDACYLLYVNNLTSNQNTTADVLLVYGEDGLNSSASLVTPNVNNTNTPWVIPSGTSAIKGNSKCKIDLTKGHVIKTANEIRIKIEYEYSTLMIAPEATSFHFANKITFHAVDNVSSLTSKAPGDSAPMSFRRWKTLDYGPRVATPPQFLAPGVTGGSVVPEVLATDSPNLLSFKFRINSANNPAAAPQSSDQVVGAPWGKYLQWLNVNFNSDATNPYALPGCHIVVDKTARMIGLYPDTGYLTSYTLIGTTNSQISNSTCTVFPGETSIVVNDAEVAINVKVVFSNALASSGPTRTMHVWARDQGYFQNDGYQRATTIGNAGCNGTSSFSSTLQGGPRTGTNTFYYYRIVRGGVNVTSEYAPTLSGDVQPGDQIVYESIPISSNQVDNRFKLILAPGQTGTLYINAIGTVNNLCQEQARFIAGTVYSYQGSPQPWPRTGTYYYSLGGGSPPVKLEVLLNNQSQLTADRLASMSPQGQSFGVSANSCSIGLGYSVFFLHGDDAVVPAQTFPYDAPNSNPSTTTIRTGPSMSNSRCTLFRYGSFNKFVDPDTPRGAYLDFHQPFSGIHNIWGAFSTQNYENGVYSYTFATPTNGGTFSVVQ